MKCLLLLLAFGSFQAFSNRIDSLVQEYANMPLSEAKVERGNELVVELSDIYWPNTVVLAKANLAIAIQLKNPTAIAESTSKLGWAWDFLGNGDSAVFYYQKALLLFTDLQNEKKIADNTNNIGVSYYYYGNHEKALEFYKKTEILYQNLKDSSGLSKVYNNLGLLNNRLNNPEQAVYYLQKSKEIKIARSDSLGLLNTLSNIALSYQYNRQFDESLDYSKKTIALGRLLKNDYAISTEEANMALTYKELGDIKSAESLYLSAIDYLESNGKLEDLVRVYMNLSIMYQESNQNQKAIVYLDECLKIELTAHTKLNLFKALELTHANLKNWQKSYEYSILIREIEDSLYLERQSSLIAKLNANYRIDSTVAAEQLATELEIQKREQSELLINKEKRINQYLIVLVFFFIIVVGFLIYFYRGKIKTQRILEDKNLQIEAALDQNKLLVKEVHHRVKNNLQVISSLLRLQSRTLEDVASQKVMADAQDRVNSMAILHQKLYQQNDISRINVKEYIFELTKELKDSHETENSKIKYQLEIEDILLDVDFVIPLGLIVNELLLNSFKHVMHANGDLNISITIIRRETVLNLIFKDNGNKINDVNKLESSNGFGLKLIRSLAIKFKTKPEFRIENGLVVELSFHDYKNILT